MNEKEISYLVDISFCWFRSLVLHLHIFLFARFFFFSSRVLFIICEIEFLLPIHDYSPYVLRYSVFFSPLGIVCLLKANRKKWRSVRMLRQNKDWRNKCIRYTIIANSAKQKTTIAHKIAKKVCEYTNSRSPLCRWFFFTLSKHKQIFNDE